MEASHSLCTLPSASEALTVPPRALGTAVENGDGGLDCVWVTVAHKVSVH